MTPEAGDSAWMFWRMRLAERGSGTVTTITQDPVTPAWARISALEASPRWTVRPIARAALTESVTGNHEPRAASGTYSEDGDGYKAYTMAHELGHATGLHDEYLESLEEDKNWSPTLPTFKKDQWYNGMPYSCDDASMMVTNYVPRMRSYWYFCRWLNETAEIKAFTANTEFHVVTTKGKARTFTLPEAYKDFYKSAYDEVERDERRSRGVRPVPVQVRRRRIDRSHDLREIGLRRNPRRTAEAAVVFRRSRRSDMGE